MNISGLKNGFARSMSALQRLWRRARVRRAVRLLAAAEKAAAQGKWIKAFKINGRARRMFEANASRAEAMANPARPLADRVDGGRR